MRYHFCSQNVIEGLVVFDVCPFVSMMWYKPLFFCHFKNEGEYVLRLYCKNTTPWGQSSHQIKGMWGKTRDILEVVAIWWLFWRHIGRNAWGGGGVINSCCKRQKNATCESALYYYLWMELNGNNKPGSLFSKVHYKRSVLSFSFVSHSFLKQEKEDRMAAVKMFRSLRWAELGKLSVVSNTVRLFPEIPV